MTSKDTRNKKRAKKISKKKQKIKKHLDFLRANPVLSQLIRLFEEIFKLETEPTRKNLILLSMSILYCNACPSVKSMFDRYVKKHSDKSLSVMYNTLKNSDLHMVDWQFFLLKIILSSKRLVKYLQILYIIDDTLVEKYGEHFELRCKLFNHNNKSGSCYLNGHCFVSLVIGVPIT